MTIRYFGLTVLSALVASACSGAEERESLGKTSESIIGPSTLGGRNEVVMLYAQVVLPNGTIGVRTCSGSYFAPRVVVTAAHCLQNVFGTELFVYYGDDFEADFGELVPGPNGLEPPPPGQPSSFAKADSFESHPSYDPALNHPDIGVVYLDRKLPFDPLPLSRNQLAANRQVTISGWGANSAPTPTTGAGARVQRTGTTVTLGSPTIADFHPEDPNPGILDPAIRATQIKTDGRPPNANGCFGDSGGPILINDFGQTYIAGVNYFTGLSCLDYNLAVRIDHFLPFLDEAYKRGGQDVLRPVLECVTPNPDGGFTAFFGHDNENGFAVTVPYGPKNGFAADTANQRPTLFGPGRHPFTFGVDFAPGQTLSWTLSPENSPTTTLNVNQTQVCGPAQADQRECALSCRASQRSGCPFLPTFEMCVQFCVEGNTFTRDFFPDCVDENSAVNECTASVSAAPENWECIDFFGAFAPVACAAEIDALSACLFP